MTYPQEEAFTVASILAARKEQAYKAAIDYYFQGNEWNELLLEEHAGVNILRDGTEVFFIGDTRLVLFGPLQTNTVIESGRVMCLFNQEITELYRR